MKSLTGPLFVSLSVSIVCKSESIINEINPGMTELSTSLVANKINVKVGNKTFTATLTDSPLLTVTPKSVKLTMSQDSKRLLERGM